MSDEVNTGRPSVFVHETMSGVIVQVTPLSVFAIAAIRERAEQEFPYPDPKPYELPVENAVDPSIRLPAFENPDYRVLCAPVDDERHRWNVRTIIEVACAYPQFENQDAMIAHFRPQLEKLRRVAVLVEDDWENVLNCCVFTGKRDKQVVISLALQDGTIPLTMPEVMEGVRYFRVDVSRESARRVADQQPRRA